MRAGDGEGRGFERLAADPAAVQVAADSAVGYLGKPMATPPTGPQRSQGDPGERGFRHAACSRAPHRGPVWLRAPTRVHEMTEEKT